MPYVKKIVRYEDVEKTMEFQGQLEKYIDRVPVEEVVWETPWQPDHMPVDSVIMVKVAHMEPYQAVVLGHFRQDGESWGVSLYDVDNGSWPSVNSGWVTAVKERGNGGVVWEHQVYPEYVHGYISKLPKHSSEYHEESLSLLVRILLARHPAFLYVNQDDHIYTINQVTADLHKLYPVVWDKDMPHAPSFKVNKKQFVKRLHSALAKNRRSRKVDQKFWDQLHEEQMEKDMSLDW